MPFIEEEELITEPEEEILAQKNMEPELFPQDSLGIEVETIADRDGYTLFEKNQKTSKTQ